MAIEIDGDLLTFVTFVDNMGDGDVVVRFFQTEEQAEQYANADERDRYSNDIERHVLVLNKELLPNCRTTLAIPPLKKMREDGMVVENYSIDPRDGGAPIHCTNPTDLSLDAIYTSKNVKELK